MTTTVETAPLPDATASVRAELLDCVQSNLAVLADRFHGPDTHLALGATLRFAPRPGPHGLPTIEPEAEHQLAAVAGIGLTERLRRHDVPPAELAALAVAHGPLYVMADTYDMPWLPYHRQRHMQHSYLVTAEGDRARVVDAYHSHTPWGLASPGAWLLDWAELPRSCLVMVLEPAAAGAPKANPACEYGDVDAYAAAYAGHPDRFAALDQLTTETWLLARSRRLHAEFLASTGRSRAPGTDDHLKRLDRLAEQAFLAMRRVQRGRPEPARLAADLTNALHADRALFDVPRTPLRETVTETVAAVLGIDTAAVLAAPCLTAVPGFNSFQVVEIVEALEERLGIEFAAEELLPENLHRIDDLCRLVQTAQAR
ncbi:acyl carrier protein [Streptomyces sp. BR123]|uniref:acyl carrier protein n=1 Tax=Streptomyces sp. BR123 TaxID=2749828 RepID=UPI0015C4B833|nr:acyl carrier protein [Streptomyces sp. BR123]NXY94249.1 acyl carrier protein [Streptomyces sp. BR123]